MLRNLTVEVYGSCANLNTSLSNSSKDCVNSEPIVTEREFCIYTSEYTLRVNEPSRAERSDISASVSIIIIMLVVLLMLIWICLKKYKKLESEAHRMLDEFRTRKQRVAA